MSLWYGRHWPGGRLPAVHVHRRGGGRDDGAGPGVRGGVRVSAGALTGINYVSKQVGRTARVNLEFVNDKRYLGVRNLILHHSLFNFDFMFGEVSDTLIPLDRKTIRENPCQFTAIATDCGFFKFNNTTGHTLRMAAVLVDHGARPDFISEHLDARSLEKLKALSKVLEHLELFDDGPHFLPVLYAGSPQDHWRTHGDVHGLRPQRQRSEVAFTVKYVSDKETRVSLRSKGMDVNAVAAVFGGGGHVRAAGCTLDKPMDEAKKLIVKEIEKRL